MRIRTKLELIMILLVTLPILIINSYVSSFIREQNQKDMHQRITSFTEQQAAEISAYFESSLIEAKKFASLDPIKKYVEDNVSASSKTLESRNTINQVLQNYQYCNSNIQALYLVNATGKIIAASDEETVDTVMMEVDIPDLMLQKQSLSALISFTVSGSALPGYCLVANVYSADGKVCGAVLQLLNTNSLQPMLSKALEGDASNFSVLMDSQGGIFEYPYRRVKPYQNASIYSSIEDYLEQVSVNANAGSLAFDEFYYNNSNYLVHNQKILVNNWSLITFNNRDTMVGRFDYIILLIRVISLVLVLVIVVAINIYVRLFCKPLDRIIEVLAKKQRGDMDVRFDIMTQDEFGQISQAFNKMFDAVSESEQRYRSIVEITDNIVFEINFQKNTVFVSRNFNQKFSFRPKSDHIQDSFFYKGRIHKEDKERFNSDFEKILGKVGYIQGEYRFKNIYGDFAWFLMRATKFLDREGIPTKIVGVIVDIDREKRSEMHLLQRANFDALTQLYNRETFIKTSANEFQMSISRNSLDALLFIDIDDFKHYNDDYGHSCGDEVLKFVAESIKEIIFGKGFAGRFGGDEFVICLTNLQYFGDSGKIAQDIIDVLATGFTSEFLEMLLCVHCSIGIAFFHKNGKTYDEVLNAADEAMYSVKKRGKSNFTYAPADKMSQ